MAEPIAGLAELATGEQRRRFLARRPELLERAVVEQLCDLVVDLLRVDLGRAERAAAAARLVARELGDDYCQGRGHRATAIVLTQQRDNPAALRHAEAALEHFDRAGDEREAAITRSSAVQCLIHLGRYDRAFAWAGAARDAFRRLGDRLRLARVELNAGSILARQDRFEEALEHYRSAYQEFLHAGEPQDVGISLRNIAVCLQDLSRFTDALQAYRRARDYCRQQDLPLIALEVDYNIAYLHYLRGEYTRALRLFEIGRKNSERLQDRHHMALCDLDQSEILLELNLVDEAARLAERGFEGFDGLDMQYEAAKALTNRAIALSRRGRDEAALELLARARETFIGENNLVWAAMIDLYRSQALSAQGHGARASALAKRALATFSSTALDNKTALCEILLARLELAAGAPEKARERCRSALLKLRPINLPALEQRAWVLTGQAEEVLSDRRAATAAYRRAESTLEQLRGHLRTDELKISFFKDKLEVYESLFWLELQGKTSDTALRDAFGHAEKAKSRSLAELIAFRAQTLPAKSAGQGRLVERLRDLRQELRGIYRQIDQKQSRDGSRSCRQVEKLRARCRRREERLLRALREVQAKDSEYSSLQQGTIIDLDTIRAALPEDTALLEFFFARGHVFACVLRREKLEILPLCATRRVRKLQRLLRFQLAKQLLGRQRAGAMGDHMTGTTRNYLGALYDQLVEPLSHHLGVRHLVIVPHGFLHYLPFHALFDGTRYLIDRCSISYAPSASVYHLCSIKETACEDRALVLGVDDERAPLIREEALAVAGALPGARLLLGEEASEENLKHHAKRCRIVHLATHGVFRRDNPMFSSLQLGTSRLSLFDLYDLELDAELVVLSGCGTGLSAVMGADELVGLTRGLLYAGARSVLVTLWDVNDASTASFMSSFYRQLRQDPRPARALRRAACELCESEPHPFYWAPFVLMGAPERPP